MTQGFHEVGLPLRLALGATGGPSRRTDIVALSNGGEARNARWADARRLYDVGTGLRSIEDLYVLTAFFEARRGQLYGFRFRDPLDHTSSHAGMAISATDQLLGTGDGVSMIFQLQKTYGDAGNMVTRKIEKPVAGSLLLALDGVPLAPGAFTLDEISGQVVIDPGSVPGPGVEVTAGYQYDVPVRFDTDRIEVNLAAFKAGSVPSVPLLEIKP